MINYFSFELSKSASIGQYSNVVKILEYTLFLYKQHFYKQRQAEIAKKSSKS